MILAARLKPGETLADRIIKVDHAGEHGAVCIYRAQRWLARWRAPEVLDELDDFLAHERKHRASFAEELNRRNRGRCRSYHGCGIGGTALGIITGLIGLPAISATTVAIERVVLRHMHEQIATLDGVDGDAVTLLRKIVIEEQEHHDRSLIRMNADSALTRVIDKVVSLSTEAVIWIGMRI